MLGTAKIALRQGWWSAEVHVALCSRLKAEWGFGDSGDIVSGGPNSCVMLLC